MHQLLLPSPWMSCSLNLNIVDRPGDSDSVKEVPGMELLAPAGNLEKLKTAVRFGADAIYCGGGSFSLRAPDTSFTLEDLAEGITYAHHHGRKVYLAMNIFAFDDDLADMGAYLREAVKLGIDAVIVSDPGVINLVRTVSPELKIHLSTQANTTNSASAAFWHASGIDRIVAARELSLEQIRLIKNNNPALELEAFVHGAMCVAYSGRCLLSNVLTGRPANRGLCSQPCRWEYSLKEKVSAEELTIGEEDRGTYILNSKDLCLVEHLPALADAGIDSIKIEGRMKSAYYVAAVTRVYRQALDSYQALGNSYQVEPAWLDEVEKVSHRPYTTGFYFPGQEEKEFRKDSSYLGGHDFVGTVAAHDRAEGSLLVYARNRFRVGEDLEALDAAYLQPISLRVDRIIEHQSGNMLEEAHNSYRVRVFSDLPEAVNINAGAILRRR